MTSARGVFQMVLLSNGTVLAAGGFSSTAYLASSEVYNPATKTWALTTGPMSTTRANFQMVLLSDSTVLADGGDSFRRTNSHVRYLQPYH